MPGTPGYRSAVMLTVLPQRLIVRYPPTKSGSSEICTNCIEDDIDCVVVLESKASLNWSGFRKSTVSAAANLCQMERCTVRILVYPDEGYDVTVEEHQGRCIL